jgi:hypothetical protein
MNDFTKDELENILCHLSYSVGQDTYDEDSINMPGLYNKVSSMIDNYCEHENIHHLGDVPGYQCGDCGEFLVDE